jgi:hypothetical protein
MSHTLHSLQYMYEYVCICTFIVQCCSTSGTLRSCKNISFDISASDKVPGKWKINGVDNPFCLIIFVVFQVMFNTNYKLRIRFNKIG